MAKTRPQAYRNNNRYRTYGSAAYQPDYNGSAVRVARRERQLQPRPQVRPRRRVVPRPQVQVRQANAFSPLAVVGFAAVALLTALLLVANARLMVINDQTVALRAQLKTLQEEQVTLLAKRELAYDLDAIEAQLTSDGTMVKPQPSQVTYLNASEPDSVVFFRTSEQRTLPDLIAELQDFFSDLLS